MMTKMSKPEVGRTYYVEPGTGIGAGIEHGWRNVFGGWSHIKPDPRMEVVATDPWAVAGILMDLDRAGYAVRAIGFEHFGRVLVINLLRRDVSQFPVPYVEKKLTELMADLNRMCPDGPHSQK